MEETIPMINIAKKVKNIDITNLLTKRVITVSENQPFTRGIQIGVPDQYRKHNNSQEHWRSWERKSSPGYCNRKEYRQNIGIHINIFSNDANIWSNEQTFIDNAYKFLIKRGRWSDVIDWY